MQRVKNQNGFAVFEIVLIVLVLIAIGVAGYHVYHSRHATTNGNLTPAAPVASQSNTANGYEVVVQKFITAIQSKDKVTADSLESTASKSLDQKDAGTSSFYDACQQAGAFCTPLFTTQFLSKATKTTTDYTSGDGAQGKQITYTLKQSLSGASAGGQGCSTSSTNTLVVAAIQKGTTWLIDKVTPTIDASGSLCPASGQSQ